MDFYTSKKRSPNDPTRQLSWLSRWFWQIWFDLDNIALEHARREYLEHQFVTLKSLNGQNPFLPLVRIPYYVWIGTASSLLQTQSHDHQGPITTTTTTPVTSLTHSGHGHGHVHGTAKWRQPFESKLLHSFTTYIYAFAWEDPR